MLLLAAIALPEQASAIELRLKRIAYFERSAYVSPYTYIPIADATGDGLLEMAYAAGRLDSLSVNPVRWELRRFYPWNRSEVIHSDTVPWPPPQGLNPGLFQPGAFGDWNGDGRLELVGYNWFEGDTISRCMVAALRAPGPGKPPTELAWYYEHGYSPWSNLHLPGDLDGDGLSNLLVAASSDSVNGFLMLESDGSNGARPVWTSDWWLANYGLGFGDFNLNGRMNFVGAAHSRVHVFENTGDNQYELVWADTLPVVNGGADVFTGNDVTRNGRPEFFIPFFRGLSGNQFLVWLYMWEWDGDRYARVLVDSSYRNTPFPVGRSICADLDGDGIQEIIWNTNRNISIYNTYKPGSFVRVASVTNSYSGGRAVNSADINYNGYNNLIIAGDHKITILEVEAVRLLHPTGGELLHPGDTCQIVWQTFPRPHCDSVSLFLRTDSTYRLDTIATGLAPDDSLYRWVVPDTLLDSAWVMVIAYGPGWQHDEHTRPLRIGPAGVRESEIFIWQHWRPPTILRRGFPVPEGIHALLFDATGRKVMDLQPGDNDIRHLSPGVYFIRTALWERSPDRDFVRKVVIQR